MTGNHFAKKRLHNFGWTKGSSCGHKAPRSQQTDLLTGLALGSNGKRLVCQTKKLPNTCSLLHMSKKTSSHPKEWEQITHVFFNNWKTPYALWHVTKPYSAKGPWNKSLNLIFPTKYVIPKSSKVGHCLWHKTSEKCVFVSFLPLAELPNGCRRASVS